MQYASTKEMVLFSREKRNLKKVLQNIFCFSEKLCYSYRVKKCALFSFSTFLAILFMQFFTACMNVSEAEYSAASNKSVVVRGSFLCQGAYPGQILVQNNASRAAVPVVNISGGTEYFLTAVSGTKTSHAVIDAATGSFTIPIETGIEWTFTAGIKKGGVDIFLCEPFSRTLSYDDSFFP